MRVEKKIDMNKKNLEVRLYAVSKEYNSLFYINTIRKHMIPSNFKTVPIIYNHLRGGGQGGGYTCSRSKGRNIPGCVCGSHNNCNGFW